MRALLSFLLMLMLTAAACSPKEQPVTEQSGGPIAGEELCCMAESRERAEEIAALYSIELVSFDWGVAVFHTEEDPETVLERGRENGWPELNLNNEKQLAE